MTVCCRKILMWYPATSKQVDLLKFFAAFSFAIAYSHTLSFFIKVKCSFWPSKYCMFRYCPSEVVYVISEQYDLACLFLSFSSILQCYASCSCLSLWIKSLNGHSLYVGRSLLLVLELASGKDVSSWHSVSLCLLHFLIQQLNNGCLFRCAISFPLLPHFLFCTSFQPDLVTAAQGRLVIPLSLWQHGFSQWEAVRWVLRLQLCLDVELCNTRTGLETTSRCLWARE